MPSGRHGEAPRARHGLFRLLAALLLAWQALVVQAHIHVGAGRPSAGEAHAAAAVDDAGRRAVADRPASCPLCRELADAANLLTPAAAPLPAPAPILHPRLAASFAPARRQDRSHSWRSRGPPASPDLEY